MSELNRNARKPERRDGPPPGPMGAMMRVEKPKDFKGAIKKLIGYLGSHRWKIAVVFLLAIFSTVFTIVGPRILGEATDELFTGIMAQIAGTGSINFARIGTIMLWLLGLYGISALFSYLQGYVMAGISMRVTYQLRRDISEKTHTLPFQYYDKVPHGEILSRITNDVDTISQSLNQSITQIIMSVTAILGITIMMFSISWQLTLAALAILPVTMGVVMVIVKKSQKHFTNQQKFLGQVNGHVEEMFGSHTVVKAFNGEQASAAIFREHNDRLYDAAWKSSFLSGLMMPITGFISNIGYVVICIWGGYLAANGALTVGGIQSFIQYVRSFTHPIAQLATISNVLQQTAAAAERVFEFLGEQPEVPEHPQALSVNRKHDTSDTNTRVTVTGNVTFTDVRFGYSAQTSVIKSFSAAVHPGQKIAIVGPTGAGKTTIVKLLMRFYDVNDGAICIDGHDIRLFRRDELRGLFGMVLQDTWLFNGTIADNIRYGNLSATDEQVIQAATAAQVDHFVRTLPDGYRMILNEEADNISQGQKQLLTIARAILHDPEILILDEATSSVDTRTEIQIQTAMDNLMYGRTSFIIAHRLSTIRNADLILVMNDGDIIEQGTHDDLLAHDGFYASLYNSQFDVAG